MLLHARNKIFGRKCTLGRQEDLFQIYIPDGEREKQSNSPLSTCETITPGGRQRRNCFINPNFFWWSSFAQISSGYGFFMVILTSNFRHEFICWSNFKKAWIYLVKAIWITALKDSSCLVPDNRWSLWCCKPWQRLILHKHNLSASPFLLWHLAK